MWSEGWLEVWRGCLWSEGRFGGFEEVVCGVRVVKESVYEPVLFGWLSSEVQKVICLLSWL